MNSYISITASLRISGLQSTGTFCTSACTSLKKSSGNGISLSEYIEDVSLYVSLTSTFINTPSMYHLPVMVLNLVCGHYDMYVVLLS